LLVDRCRLVEADRPDATFRRPSRSPKSLFN
jgi:hypothetical protein